MDLVMANLISSDPSTPPPYCFKVNHTCHVILSVNISVMSLKIRVFFNITTWLLLSLKYYNNFLISLNNYQMFNIAIISNVTYIFNNSNQNPRKGHTLWFVEMSFKSLLIFGFFFPSCCLFFFNSLSLSPHPLSSLPSSHPSCLSSFHFICWGNHLVCPIEFFPVWVLLIAFLLFNSFDINI